MPSPTPQLPDSAAIPDSLAQLYPVPDTAALRQWQLFTAATLRRERQDSLAVQASLPPEWTKGMSPAQKPVSAASTPPVVAAIVLLLLLVTACLRHAGHLFPTIWRETVSIRSRSKNFDEHTAGESRLMVLFIVQFAVYGGILLLALANRFAGGVSFRAGTIAPAAAALTAVAGGWYLLQLSACAVTGYAFGGADALRQWLRGLNAGTALLGFALAVPAIVTVFYPSGATAALWTAAVFYVTARLAFIVKGFRIFYNNFGSLFYFFLYLCAVEIIPVLIVLALTGAAGKAAV